jgi:flagellar protein FliS
VIPLAAIMDRKGFQQYKQQSVNTMTQGELLLLLYDELVKRLTQAELALDKKSFEIFESSVQRSIDIIHYLDATLDRQYELSGNLTKLYEYMTYELGRAKIGHRKEPLEHGKNMAVELRDAFREAQKTGEAGQAGK